MHPSDANDIATLISCVAMAEANGLDPTPARMALQAVREATGQTDHAAAAVAAAAEAVRH